MRNSRDDSPDMRECLKDLCAEISVANNLDTDIRRELFTHMEDKFTAYLDGDEPLTEEDAFVLVREHFGDPAVIQTMYREVEAMEGSLGFMRKSAVALILTAVLMFLGKFLLETAFAGMYHFMLGEGELAGPAVTFLFIPNVVSIVLPLIAFFLIITRLEHGTLSRMEEKLIFAPPIVLFAVFSGIMILFYIALRLFVGYQTSALFFSPSFADRVYSDDTFTHVMYMACKGISSLFSTCLAQTFICLVWIRLFDTGQKRILSLISGGIGFIAANQIIETSIHLMSTLHLIIMRGSLQYIGGSIKYLPDVLLPGRIIQTNVMLAVILYAIIIFAHTVKNRFTPAISQT